MKKWIKDLFREKFVCVFLAVLVAAFIFSIPNCKKEGNIEPSIPEVVSDLPVQHAGTIPSYIDSSGFGVPKNFVVPDLSTARMLTTPSRVGMYISDVHTHLSDLTWLNAKIAYYKSRGFNRMMIYNLDGNTYLTGTNATKLRDFTANLHTNGIKMDIVISKASTCTTSIETYYNGCNSSNKPDGIRWEKEYYQSGGFLPFQPELVTVYNWAKSKSPALDVSFYMPWTSTDCSQRYQFKELLKYNDYLEFHDYRKKPEFGYVKSRIDSAGAAYKELIQLGLKPGGTMMKCGIIASAEDPKYGAPATSVFSGIYFETHDVFNFWNEVFVLHNSSLLVNENYVDIRYIDVFSCKYYQLERP